MKLKDKLKMVLQHTKLLKRDGSYYGYRIRRLNYLIDRDANWLSSKTYQDGKSKGLPFHEKAIKFYEYKNMIIQRRSQYVIIFITITLLIMTGYQIYLTFLK